MSHSKQENSVRLFQNTSIDLCRTPLELLKNVDNMWSHKIYWKNANQPLQRAKRSAFEFAIIHRTFILFCSTGFEVSAYVMVALAVIDAVALKTWRLKGRKRFEVKCVTCAWAENNDSDHAKHADSN